MKTSLLALTLLTLASAAQAAPLCGTIGNHIVAPTCAPRAPCPQWRRLQYDIKTDAGNVVDINANQMDLLQQFSDNKGRDVCLEGEMKSDGTYSVDSIKSR